MPVLCFFFVSLLLSLFSVAILCSLSASPSCEIVFFLRLCSVLVLRFLLLNSLFFFFNCLRCFRQPTLIRSSFKPPSSSSLFRFFLYPSLSANSSSCTKQNLKSQALFPFGSKISATQTRLQTINMNKRTNIALSEAILTWTKVGREWVHVGTWVSSLLITRLSLSFFPSVFSLYKHDHLCSREQKKKFA